MRKKNLWTQAGLQNAYYQQLRDAGFPSWRRGDIFLSITKNSWLGKKIRWLSGDRLDEKTWNHAGIYLGNGNIIEALTTVQVGRVAKYFTPKYDFMLLGNLDVHANEQRKETVCARAMSYEGKRYGYGKILLQALDGIFRSKSNFFTRNFSLTDYPICSYVVAKAYEQAGVMFTDDNGSIMKPKEVTPDDIHDHAKRFSESWVTTFYMEGGMETPTEGNGLVI